MKFNAKKALLAGTALVAVSAFGHSAQAANGISPSADTTVNAPVTGGAGTNNASTANGGDADNGIYFNGNHITVTDNSTATGGQGGNGGTPTVDLTNGYMGGMGGSGTYIPNTYPGTGTAAGQHQTITVNAGHVSHGGTGGNGGNGAADDGGDGGGSGGTGGTGGNGIETQSNYTVINNAGTVTGGSGGGGGNGGPIGGQAGAGGQGILVGGANVTLTNSGTVQGGVIGFIGTGNSNNGAPNLQGDAIRFQLGAAGGSITNTSTGHIIGTAGLGTGGVGIHLLDDTASIDNAGSITSDSTYTNSILNEALLTLLTNTGSITTDAGTAVNDSGTIETLNNAGGGIISSNGGVGIYATGGLDLLTNAGSQITTTSGIGIQSTNGNFFGTLDNDNGTISSTSGNAIQQDGGEGALITLLTNNAGHITTENGNGLFNEGEIGTLQNDHGIFSATTGNALNNDGGEGGVGLIDTLTNNAGTIEATGSGSGLYNSGTITALNNNNGMITATTGTALNNNDGSEGSIYGHIVTLTNNGGTIEATGAGGTAIQNTQYSTIDTLDNTGGIIRAMGSGEAITNGGQIGTLTNTGTISSVANTALYNSGAITTLTNGVGGIITTASGTFETIYDAGSIGTLTNNGMITSTGAGGANTAALAVFGSVGVLDNNGGTISAASATSDGVYNAGTITTVMNRANSFVTATGDGGTGFNNAGGTIDNFSNAGTISTTTNGIGIYNDGMLGTLTNTGTVTVGDGSIALSNALGATLTSLVNSGAIHATNGTGLYNDGTLTLDNSGGTISATTGSALQLDAALAGSTTQQGSTLTNTGGTITSASTTNGAFYINSDVGALAIDGGTVSNTSTSNAAVALNIAAPQSGGNDVIILNGVRLISDGDTAGSGHGIAIATANNLAEIGLVDGTVARGNVIAGNGGLSLIFDGGNLVGNVTAGSGDDTLGLYDNGDTLAGNVDLGTGTNEVQVYGGAFTTQGTFTSATTLNLDVNYGANLTVNNAFTLGNGTINVGMDSTLNLNQANITTTGAFTNDGTTAINFGRTLTVGSLNTVPTDGVLDYVATPVNGNLTTGLLNTGATAANLSNQAVRVSYVGGGNLDLTSRALIATGTGNATIPMASVLDNSFLYDFSVVEGSGGQANNLYLEATQVETLAAAAENQNNENVSEVLLGPNINNNDPQIAQIQSNLNNAPTRDAYNKVLESTLPTTDNGAPTAAAGFTGQVFDVADSQLAFVNTGDQTGVAAGDHTYGLHPWVQAFGQHADQDARDGVDGYRANTGGAALGVDTRDLDTDLLGTDNVLGASFAYGDTFVNSNDVNATTTRVNTYQGTLYGNHAFGRTDYFVAGMAAFGYDRNDATRHDVGAITGLDAGAAYDSYQEAGRAEFGKNFRLDGDFAGAVLTPIASADYVHYDAQSYTEHGAGGADLHVGNQDEDLLNLGIGGRAEWLLHAPYGLQVKPDIHASYQYDVLNNDKVDTSSSFAAGGGTFGTRGLNPSNSTFDIGAGVKLYNAGRWDFTATYDFTAKPDYTANAGMVRAAYKF